MQDTTFLDDPVAFAHGLYSLLAAGGDERIVGGKVAAEQLRRGILDGAKGPRIPWK